MGFGGGGRTMTQVLNIYFAAGVGKGGSNYAYMCIVCTMV